MAAGKRMAPEVEAEVVRLVREGKTRRQVADATGISDQVVSRIVRDTTRCRVRSDRPGIIWHA